MIKDLTRAKELALYKNAASLFNKKGYSSASIRQICRAIGIRESTIYHYVQKKEDILYNICEWSMLLSLEAVEPIVKEDLRPDLKLPKMIQTHILNIVENSDQHASMLKELRSLSPGNQRKIIKLRDRYEALFRQVIADCVKEGFFREVNVKFATLALLGMMNWLIHWYSPAGSMKSADIARIFSDIVMNGLNGNFGGNGKTVKSRVALQNPGV